MKTGGPKIDHFRALFNSLEIIGDSKSYLSGLPQLHINVWAYFGGFFGAPFTLVQKGHHA